MNQPAGKLRRPLAIVAGVRTPFAKAWGSLADLPADELGRLVTVTALERSQLQPRQVDEVIFGNVSGPAESANIARVIALKAGIPETRIAHTVHRNCASGMEAIIAGWQAIETGRAEIVVAGGTESMSRVPLLWDPRMQSWLMRWERERSLWGRLKQLSRLRPSWLRPIAGLSLGLTDPVSGLKMGQTAEVVARDFGITREAQDAFALASHHKAIAAWKRCFLGGETLAMPLAGVTDGRVGLTQDNGPRADTSLEKLGRLKPIFERDGTVTVGNSCQITDGAAALTLMSLERVNALGLRPLGYLRDYAIAGCDPKRMGLGPVFAIQKLLQQSGLGLADFERVELNEAFAAQVLGCQAALASAKFAAEHWGGRRAIGELDDARLNVNGGAIALGHPVGTTGTRLVLTVLRQLQEARLQRGLATLCVGGGQGVAIWVERELE